MRDRTKLGLFVAVFLAARFVPVGEARVRGALFESFAMLHEYARDHVVLCLIPAFFIAGAISVFISQASVLRYLGPDARKSVSYPVASVSGAVLAVCSCTVLPLFAGIYKRGAGLGPASAFLYAGPAINVLAIILTARVLGMEIGIARAVGAVAFSIVIGIVMQILFRGEEKTRSEAVALPEDRPRPKRTLLQEALPFVGLVGVLVFANAGCPPGEVGWLWAAICEMKWLLTGLSLALLAFTLIRWFRREELSEWVGATWTFTKQILPLLFGGVLIAGLLLGRPDHDGLIPSNWIAELVGGNSLGANFFASIVGAFMYFATLTEVPILQGLIGSGMGKGPALTLLLAGPALSLPSMLVVRSVLGTKKTIVFVALVVALSTAAGMSYGFLVDGR